MNTHDFLQEGVDNLYRVAVENIEHWKARALAAEPRAALFDEMLAALASHHQHINKSRLKNCHYCQLIQRAEALTAGSTGT